MDSKYLLYFFRIFALQNELNSYKCASAIQTLFIQRPFSCNIFILNYRYIHDTNHPIIDKSTDKMITVTATGTGRIELA